MDFIKEFQKWIQTSDAKNKGNEAKINKSTRFTKQFSNGNKNLLFVSQLEVDEEHNITQIYFSKKGLVHCRVCSDRRGHFGVRE